MIMNFIMSLVLFLYGINVMETGLKNISENKLPAIINNAGAKPLKGVMTGVITTALLQSSSAVTVLLVGAADAGIIKLKSAVYITMGANIGTSVTSWLVCLSGIDNIINPINLYPVAGLIGIGFIILCKNIRLYNTGLLLVGFALIMAGINGMSSAVAPLKYSDTFISFLTEFDNPLWGILAGTITSAVLQSSSAGIGILQALSATGRITLLTAVPIILGQNTGTCVTALIASAGTGKNAKKVALAHLAFNISGVIIWTIVFYIFRGLLPNAPVGEADIALIHTMFNVSSTAIILPLIIRFQRIHAN